MLLPVALLVCACLMVGIFPAATAGPFLGAAVRAVVGPEVPAYSLEVWHGITIPLLMSLAALVGGALLYLVLRRYLRQGAEGPPLLRRLDSVRIFELTLIFLSWRAARSAVTLLGTRRLQPQLQLLRSEAHTSELQSLMRISYAVFCLK